MGYRGKPQSGCCQDVEPCIPGEASSPPVEVPAYYNSDEDIDTNSERKTECDEVLRRGVNIRDGDRSEG